MTGSPSCRLAQKLKLLKEDLKIWNKEVFGALDTRRASVLAAIEEVDREEVEGRLGEADVRRRQGIKFRFEDMFRSARKRKRFVFRFGFGRKHGKIRKRKENVGNIVCNLFI